MAGWKRYLAAAAVLLLVVVVARAALIARHRRLAQPPPPVAVTPSPSASEPVPSSGPTTLYVVTKQVALKWIKQDPGEVTSFRALQGLVNRDGAPSIFALTDQGAVHDQDWLRLLAKNDGATVVSTADSTNQIGDFGWYLTKFRSHLAGYLLFDAGGKTEGPSSNVALSLAGVLDAVPIDRKDQGLIAAAKAAGLTQLDDVGSRDYAWLKGSKYWSQLNRSAEYLNQPSGLQEGADYAVAEKMPVFWDDVRSDPQMQTMASMLANQQPGGIVFGWGYTDSTYREDVFVRVASRYTQSIMDTPSNLSVYMHYPLQRNLPNTATPAVPTATGQHYVAFVYSDGDNPRVILNELTQPGNDRYASPLRGSIPIGWTLPPAIGTLAGPVVEAIYAQATPDDQFLAGPSGFGYAFPSLMSDRGAFAGQTVRTMAPLGLHDFVDLDNDGGGFSHQALDPITADPSIHSVYFTAFNGRGQPGPGSILWSNGKPVLPTYTVYRPPGEGTKPIAGPTAAYLNSLPVDDGSAAAYTVVYLDFWSISMTDVSQIVSKLNPNVKVVRPDVLAALVQANVRH
jgi:hypothetical protein